MRASITDVSATASGYISSQFVLCGVTAPTRISENIWSVTKSHSPSVRRIQFHVFCKFICHEPKETAEVLPKPTEAVDSTLSLGPAVHCQALDGPTENEALTFLKELLVNLKECLYIYLPS